MINNSGSRLASVLTSLPMMLILLAPQKSRAEFQSSNFAPDFSGPATLVGFVLLIDVGFGVAAFQTPPSKGFAITELVFATPQVILGTVGSIAALRSGNAGGLLLGALTLLPIALTIHGIHTLANGHATSGRATSEPVQPQSVEDQPDYSTVVDRILIRPSLIAVQTGTAPGLSLAFKF